MAPRIIPITRLVHSLHLWQALAALVAFVLPFSLLPVARSEMLLPHWERVNAYPGDDTILRVIGGHIGAGQELYVVGDASGVHLSVDRGQSWSQVNQGLPRGGLGEVRVVDLAVDPVDPDVVYAVVDSPSSVPRPMVYWTADMGFTWQPRASLGQERVRAIAFGPTSADLYVATPNELLRAFVSGEDVTQPLGPQERFDRGIDDLHWLSIGTFNLKANVTSLVISPASASSAVSVGLTIPLTLYVGTRGQGLWVAVNDLAGTPTALPAGADPDSIYVRQQAVIRTVCIDPCQPGRVYVATNRGVYVSRDEGVIWRALGQPLRAKDVLSLATDPVDSDTLYAGLRGEGVYLSRDAGMTWQPLGRGLGRVTAFSLAVVGTGARELYAATDSGLWRLRL
jgi:photosystem II stability/assembly factor-like uncharacterized protein